LSRITAEDLECRDAVRPGELRNTKARKLTSQSIQPFTHDPSTRAQLWTGALAEMRPHGITKGFPAKIGTSAASP
jgi:hypothetical protein